jgi:hypothetical protein
MKDSTIYPEGAVICSTVDGSVRNLRTDDPLIVEGRVQITEDIVYHYARNVRTGELLAMGPKEVCAFSRPSDAAQALLDAAGGRMVGLTFSKRSDGSTRVMNAHPVKQDERDPDHEAEHNLRLVRSTNDAMGYRSVPLDSLKEIRMNGHRFTVQGGKLVATDATRQAAA